MAEDMRNDRSRMAAVAATTPRVKPDMCIGLGSGRAVFALATAIGEQLGHNAGISAVVASSVTAEYARAAGIQVVELDTVGHLDVVFDGADEIDPQHRMLKGGGAALLREKLLFAAASSNVIMVQEAKLVDRLGQTRLLPVEIIRYGWTTTRARVLELTRSAALRRDDAQQPIVTPEGNYLLDVALPDTDLAELATALKTTLGVVEHGLFLTQATEIVVGFDDGTSRTISCERVT